MIVQKFGGTSVKSVARIKNVAAIVARAAKENPVVVVASAMGDTTDYLVKLARQVSAAPDRRELDALLATGEQISIALLAMTLNEMGERAVSLTGGQLGIITESVHNTARIVDIKTERIRRYLDEGRIVVAAGFQGTTPEGDTTTLGRGGSDTTAVALAAALGATACDIFTDVSGVYTADPNLVPSARRLREVSYEEMLEMARVGAQVLHPRAVELARKHRLPLRVRNTFDPEDEGTILIGAEDMEISRPVSGVTVDRNQARLAILKVPDRPGVAGEIFGALADCNISVDMIIQAFHQDGSVNDITFTIKRGDLDTARKLLEEVASRIGAGGIIADRDVAKVSIIGAGLMDQPGVAAQMFSTLGREGINIKMISTSEIRISCAVSDSDAERAVRLIHDLFDLAEAGPI
ncbi:MAG TPA: aspartate kinase [Blastocatellia bacterium]|jgi:aspartate kinase|nr:aspartate kinase [Blastocatellia bacterium]